jgi:hypothetical protein
MEPLDNIRPENGRIGLAMRETKKTALLNYSCGLPFVIVKLQASIAQHNQHTTPKPGK